MTADLREALAEVLKAAEDHTECLAARMDYIESFARKALALPTAPAPEPVDKVQPRPEPGDFIAKTNADYVAWCKTFYQPDALDHRGMPSLHGLWAWQEQERRHEGATPLPAGNAKGPT